MFSKWSRDVGAEVAQILLEWLCSIPKEPNLVPSLTAVLSLKRFDVQQNTFRDGDGLHRSRDCSPARKSKFEMDLNAFSSMETKAMKFLGISTAQFCKLKGYISQLKSTQGNEVVRYDSKYCC